MRCYEGMTYERQATPTSKWFVYFYPLLVNWNCQTVLHQLQTNVLKSCLGKDQTIPETTFQNGICMLQCVTVKFMIQILANFSVAWKWLIYINVRRHTVKDHLLVQPLLLKTLLIENSCNTLPRNRFSDAKFQLSSNNCFLVKF